MGDLQTYLYETPHGIPAFAREKALWPRRPRERDGPQPINVASSWDPELVRGVAEQLRAVGCTLTLSSVANLGVDPRWGRIEERSVRSLCWRVA